MFFAVADGFLYPTTTFFILGLYVPDSELFIFATTILRQVANELAVQFLL
jgi:hypothetical protein